MTDYTIQLERIMDATPQQLFTIYTTPALVDQWWGPQGFTTKTTHMDARPGGTWQLLMTGPDGTEYPNLSTYVDVDRPNLIRFHHEWDAPGHEGEGFTTTITFEPVDGKTKLTVVMAFDSQRGYADALQRNAEQGLADNFDRLQEMLQQLKPMIESM